MAGPGIAPGSPHSECGILLLNEPAVDPEKTEMSFDSGFSALCVYHFTIWMIPKPDSNRHEVTQISLPEKKSPEQIGRVMNMLYH